MSGTRDKIIEIGDNLIRTRGYNAFSYQDISKELGIKNAAIHYYFSAKENLGTSIVKSNVQRFEEMIDNMNNRDFDILKQLDTFIKIYLKSYREGKLCIVGALGSDKTTLGATTQLELIKMTDLILGWLTDLLSKGKDQNVFNFREEPKVKASIVFSTLVAGLQLARVNKDLNFKEICKSIIEDLKT